MAYVLEHLDQLYKMCTEELQHLQRAIDIFLHTTAKTHAIIKSRLNDSKNDAVLMTYDNFLTSLTHIMDLSRKFNMQLHLNGLENSANNNITSTYTNGHQNSQLNRTESVAQTAIKKQPNATENHFVSRPQRGEHTETQTEMVDSKEASTDEELLSERLTEKLQINKSFDYSQYSIVPAEEDPDDEKNNADFQYQKRDLSNFMPGCVVKASITYIQNLSALRFFIFDLESADGERIRELGNMVHLKQYTALPPTDEVFGIVQDNCIWRAVRSSTDLDVPTRSTYQALLLEFGEIVEMYAADVTYQLPAAYKAIPAQAIECQLRGMSLLSDAGIAEMEARLQTLLHGKANFVVEEVIDKVLHLQFEDDNTVATATAEKLADTNPFKKVVLPESPVIANEDTQGKLFENRLTRDELDMLWEEPLNTSNAMKAVLGYDPQDDKRICRFYDPKIRACFKGSRCRQEHSLPPLDGWTKDMLPSSTIIDNRNPTVIYAKGTIINITVTYVGDLERFYAQINDPKKPTQPLIWNPEDVPDQQRLKKPPLTFELILAKYDDGLWYRAKVLETDEVNKVVKVFYVDYGNHQTLRLHDLAYCELSTAMLPFQAVLCRLSGVQDATKTPEKRKQGIATLCDKILNHSFDVKVTGYYEDLLLHFEPPYSNLIGTLLKTGYLKPFKNITV